MSKCYTVSLLTAFLHCLVKSHTTSQLKHFFSERPVLLPQTRLFMPISGSHTPSPLLHLGPLPLVIPAAKALRGQ